jgi:hypothetical protein
MGMGVDIFNFTTIKIMLSSVIVKLPLIGEMSLTWKFRLTWVMIAFQEFRHLHKQKNLYQSWLCFFPIIMIPLGPH